MIYLLSDKVFLGLLVLLLFGVFISLRKARYRQSMTLLFQRPKGLSSFIILMFFLIIGVMDSLHVTSNKMYERKTFLDKILSPIGSHDEKTYSAPLSRFSFTKEFIQKEDATFYEIRPLLNYPKKTLHSDDEKRLFVKAVVMQNILRTLLLLGLMLYLVFFCSWGNWKKTLLSASFTIAILFFLTFVLYDISRELHVFGTGKIGEDIFYVTLKSIRTGLVIGLVTTLFMLPLGLFLGIIAGYFGGKTDDIIQYIYTTISSIPGVLLITASVLSLQTFLMNHPHYFSTLEENADIRLLSLCFILGLTSWTNLCRLLRAEVLKLREMDYIIAARTLGSSVFYIIQKHLVPNVMPIVTITLVLDFSFLVLAEAVLSYVGVGVAPTTMSWGNMINSARLELARNPVVWWPMCFAFLSMFSLVLASNLFADVVRDVFDPHEQQ